MKKPMIFLYLFCTLAAAAQNKTDRYFPIFKSNDIYNAVMRELDINYVDTLDYEKLTTEAINCMLYQFDPYTVYIPEDATDDLRRMTSGEYGGIGAYIQQHGDVVVVSEPHEGMPAQRNDVRAGDVIVGVDGEKMKGKTTTQVSEKLRGVPGTIITLELRRPGIAKTITRKFKREAIFIPSVDYYGMVAPGTGYISLNDFTDKSMSEFKQAMSDLTKHNPLQQLVIDLRNNGGGLVGEAVNIAGLFVPKHTEIVAIRGRADNPNSRRIYRTAIDPLYLDLPIVVLVNENSASASEILAGAFQDLDRAVIMGKRTYGKGLVQNIRMLPYNSYLKVTTAKYYIPSGRCVQAIDYAQRSENRDKPIPDSLTSTFKTRNGRIVRDGRGIIPDSTLKTPESLYITYYLFVQNYFFDYATNYVLTHPTIAPADDFALTDAEYDQFVTYTKERKFTYRLESEKYLQDLRHVVKEEGYDTRTAKLFADLEKELQPDIDKDMREFRSNIQEMLENEIVKRYYYHRGSVQYQLRRDLWLQSAIQMLTDKAAYAKMLGKK